MFLGQDRGLRRDRSAVHLANDSIYPLAKGRGCSTRRGGDDGSPDDPSRRRIVRIATYVRRGDGTRLRSVLTAAVTRERHVSKPLGHERPADPALAHSAPAVLLRLGHPGLRLLRRL